MIAETRDEFGFCLLIDCHSMPTHPAQAGNPPDFVLGDAHGTSCAPRATRLAEELRAPDTDGVVITQMRRDSAAYQSGLRPGDIVRKVNGQTIANPSQFVRLIADSPIGSTVTIEVMREGKPTTARVTVERQQQRAPQRRGR